MYTHVHAHAHMQKCMYAQKLMHTCTHMRTITHKYQHCLMTARVLAACVAAGQWPLGQVPGNAPQAPSASEAKHGPLSHRHGPVRHVNARITTCTHLLATHMPLTTAHPFTTGMAHWPHAGSVAKPTL